MSTENNSAMEILTPLYNAKGWIKFSGVISIIMGVLSSFSIVGLLTGWTMIWPGVILFLASSKLKKSYEDDNMEGLQDTMQKLAFNFKLYCIFLIKNLSVDMQYFNILIRNHRFHILENFMLMNAKAGRNI